MSNSGILLLNAGSSSLKGSWFEWPAGRLRFTAHADWAGDVTRWKLSRAEEQAGAEQAWEQVAWRGPVSAVGALLAGLRRQGVRLDRELAAIGHRVVHGGDFFQATRMDRETRDQIQRLVELAPLHNQPCLEVLAAVEGELPHVPQIAVFDSAFHATLPDEVRTYPVPWEWTEAWKIRRYGFHGLSHAWGSRRAAEMLAASGYSPPAEAATELRLIVCHLGHGCSATAVRGGASIDTTMGFTPLEGLMMATRSGSIDPGITPYVEHRFGLTSSQTEELLHRGSGLAGVSGISADLRQLWPAAEQGHVRAKLAIAMYVQRIRGAIGSLAASLGGLDALVFTAGVGENSWLLRKLVCERFDFLGLHVDDEVNVRAEPDGDIAVPDARARILVIKSREDLEMLRQVRELIEGANRA
ncbi:MAG: acetate/propionate family kinase [Planctomycetota bacterium]